MQLGIDFGTTHTIVAAVDRGNYPVVAFFDDDGDSHPHFPSVAAADADELVFGFDALAAAGRGAPLLRSFKRALAAPEVNAASPVPVGDRQVPVLELLTGFLTALRVALAENSNLGAGRTTHEQPDSTVISVPAHAHGAQRFLTLEAFRRAGFEVSAMVNEPSAAGFEYTHHRARTVTATRDRIVVYDLGGGTFDASLVDVGADGANHAVLGTAGLNRLGGDDFDDVLVRCALDAAARSADSPETTDPIALAGLREQCRDAKERLTPQSRRIALEVGDEEVTVPVDAYYAAAAPLVEDSLAAMEPLLSSPDLPDLPDLKDLAGIYLVGGGSGLPLVPRLLRERFGRRVFRSPQPAASTAIGLAIAADPESGFTLADRLSRGFGVFREREAGRLLSFDPILLPDLATPATDEVVVTRTYRAAHNVGRFRFVECSAVDDDGEPRGDLVPFAEVIFPFDPALQTTAGSGSDGDLAEVEVRRVPGPQVRERYTVDRHGLIGVTITDLDTGYERSFSIGRSTTDG